MIKLDNSLYDFLKKNPQFGEYLDTYFSRDSINTEFYHSTIKEILSLEDTAAIKYNIKVELIKDKLNPEKYIHVNLYNPVFKCNPPTDKKIHYGNENDENDIPNDSYYNAFWIGYIPELALSNFKWNEVVFSDIFISEEAQASLNNDINAIMCEILYAFTYEGFSEKSQNVFWKNIF